MRISAIVPCHDGIEDTRRCVRALRAQRLDAELEIVVVDNASTDGTGSLDSEFDSLRVVHSPTNRGFAGGVNLGLRAATGELLMVVNNDTLAGPDMTARLVRTLLSDARIGAVAPVSNHVKGPARIPIGAAGDTPETCAEVERALHASCPEKREDVESVAGLCLMFRRELLDRIGGFDEAFGIGNYEDDDFCLRARLLGYRFVIRRDAFLHHRGHGTFRALGVDYDAQMRSQHARFVAKWSGDPAGRAAIALALGQPLQGALHAEAGLLEHPRWPDGHLLRARRLAASGQHARAVEAIEPFLDACPRSAAGHAVRAMSLIRAGRVDAGKRHLSWTLQTCFFTPEHAAETLAGYGRLQVDRGAPGEAIEFLRAAVELSPEDGDLHNLLGSALLEAGSLAAAADALAAADRLGSPHALSNLGICMWRRGERDAALRLLAEAVERAPDDELARRNLAAALQGAS